MGFTLTPDPEGAYLSISADGTLTASDYHELEPRLRDEIAARGKLDLLIDMRSFEGMSAGAVWEEFKFDLRHFRDMDRIAVVGDARWHEWAAKLTDQITSGEVRHFDSPRIDDARRFLSA